MEWLDKISDGSFATGGTFLVIGIIGIVLLLISLVLDGIFEAFEFGDGPLSLTTLAAFATVFGFAGYASMGAGASAVIASFIGAVAGLIGGAMAWWLSRFFQNSDSGVAMEAGTLAGQEAYVSLGIGLGDSLGEIAFSKNGHRHTFAARAAEPIPTGTHVVVLATITNSLVLVTPVKPETDADVIKATE